MRIAGRREDDCFSFALQKSSAYSMSSLMLLLLLAIYSRCVSAIQPEIYILREISKKHTNWQNNVKGEQPRRRRLMEWHKRQEDTFMKMFFRYFTVNTGSNHNVLSCNYPDASELPIPRTRPKILRSAIRESNGLSRFNSTWVRGATSLIKVIFTNKNHAPTLQMEDESYLKKTKSLRT